MDEDSDAIRFNETQMENAKAWVNAGLKLTVDLVKLDENKEPRAGLCSGFLFPRNGKLYVISAGHGLGVGEWYLQTNVSDKTAVRTALIPMNGVFTVRKLKLPLSMASQLKPIDFAWCEVSLRALNNDMKEKPYLIQDRDLCTYTGVLDGVPDPKLPYTYAAHNAFEYHGADGRNFLELGPTYETWMQYDGVDEATGYYRFALNGKHKGHTYYDGASGSPIFEPDGRIVSILLGGDKDADVLYGLPLNQYQAYIGLE